MYALEFLIYQLRPYGMAKLESRPSTPEPPPDLELTATPWDMVEENTTQKISTTKRTIPSLNSTTISTTKTANRTYSPAKQP